MMRLLLVTFLVLSCAFAQNGNGQVTGKAVYFLKDDSHKVWCGYASESRFKEQIQPVGALVLGAADYEYGRLSRVHLTETDETGDWAVNDEYGFDKSGKIAALKRTINILPEDTKEEQSFVIKRGRAIRKSVAKRELGTGTPTQKSVDWFKAPPVVTNEEAFPFSPLIGRKRFDVWSKGTACIPINQGDTPSRLE